MRQGYIGVVAAGFVLALTGSVMAQDYQMKEGGHGSSMFDRLDTNKDGNVDRAEMEAGSADHFSRMDADGDGTVTQAEMKAFHQEMREERRQKRENEMFSRLDTNGDGALSAEELSARGQAMFDRMDKDGDGVVTMDERKTAHMDMKKKSKRGMHQHDGKMDGMKKDSGGR